MVDEEIIPITIREIKKNAARAAKAKMVPRKLATRYFKNLIILIPQLLILEKHITELSIYKPYYLVIIQLIKNNSVTICKKTFFHAKCIDE